MSHQRLLCKLASYGVNGNLLRWIEDFLKDRWQIVMVNKVALKPVRVLNGIPQGSVFGSILFVIYIDEIPDVVQSDFYLFTDDTKIFNKINSKNEALQLQSDINAIGL